MDGCESAQNAVVNNTKYLETKVDEMVEPTLRNDRRIASYLWNLSDDDLRHTDRDESDNVRSLIHERRLQALSSIKQANGASESGKMVDPRGMLHFLAPKIPAIRQSPDMALRIQSTRASSDHGLAACAICALGHVFEVYDRAVDNGKIKDAVAAVQLVTDRRFEQLVECVFCGVDVNKRMIEWRRFECPSEGITLDGDIEAMLASDDNHEDDGLGLLDCCRAAWGLSVLGASYNAPTGVLGGYAVSDLLASLSLRVRELLLSRVELLDEVGCPTQKLGERMAREAATAMWTFACVRACTGQQASPLFDVCTSFLCATCDELSRRVPLTLTGLSLKTSEVLTPDAPNGSANANDDILLDILSPSELLDVLWALAIHGRRENLERIDETKLSDSLTALCEIAFDRILAFLNEDVTSADFSEGPFLSVRRFPTSNSSDYDGAEDDDAGKDHPSGVIENELDISACESVAFSTISSDDTEFGCIDASEILAMAGGEVVSSRVLGCEIDGGSEQQPAWEAMYTPSDLCTIAWAVTELHDVLRESIVRAVVCCLDGRRNASLQLSGTDISNLAWAVAKSSDQGYFAPDLVTRTLNLLDVEIRNLLGPGENFRRLITAFEPPELGRLMWAYAKFKSLRVDIKDERLVSDISAKSLIEAASTLSLFGIEDMARIAWATLELSDCDASFELTLALGKVLASIASSLSSWESGSSYDQESGAKHRESIRFTTFLGRTRLQVPYLDQRIEDTDNVGLSMQLRRPLPLLCDLPIDPATLCKLVGKAAMFRGHQQADSIVIPLCRTAMRLMTSKNGRLLRDCSSLDIVSLTVALAAFRTRSDQHVLMLFLRRLVEHLNTQAATFCAALDDGNLAEFLVALGTLGVKHRSDDVDIATAHKRLVLTTPDIFRQIESSQQNISWSGLLSAYADMNLAVSKPEVVLHAIQNVNLGSCSNTDSDCETFCRVLEAIARIVAKCRGRHDCDTATGLWTEPRDDDREQQALSIMKSCKHLVDSSRAYVQEWLHVANPAQVRRLVLAVTAAGFRQDRLVDDISDHVESKLVVFENNDIAAQIPEIVRSSIHLIQNQDMLGSRESESDVSPWGKVRDHVFPSFRPAIGSQARALARAAKTVDDNTDSAHKSDAQPLLDPNDSEDAMPPLMQPVLYLRKGTLALQDLCCIDLANEAMNAMLDAAFELMRCRALVAHYRSLIIAHDDLVNEPKLSTRLDIDRRRIMCKRVLSRLMP